MTELPVNNEQTLEVRVDGHLAENIDGMVQSWVMVGCYIAPDGEYQSFILTAPDQLLTTSLGLVVLAHENYLDEAREWGQTARFRSDAPEDE
jgi:predicted cupin superfamily sugar epimerase